MEGMVVEAEAEVEAAVMAVDLVEEAVATELQCHPIPLLMVALLGSRAT